MPEITGRFASWFRDLGELLGVGFAKAELAEEGCLDHALDEGKRDQRGRHRTWEYGQFAYKGRLSAKLDRIRHRLHPRLAIHEPSIRYDSFMTIHRSGG